MDDKLKAQLEAVKEACWCSQCGSFLWDSVGCGPTHACRTEELARIFRRAHLADVLEREVEAWREFAKVIDDMKTYRVPGSFEVMLAAAGALVKEARAATDAARKEPARE